MSPTRELDDVCGTHGISVYHKSLLYLVSRALERPPAPPDSEVPLIGMAHFAETEVDGKTLAQSVADIGGDLIWSPSAAPPHSRSDSSSHGGFDDDSPTMTSVLLRILGRETVEPGNEYVPNLPSGAAATPVTTQPMKIADQTPEIVVADVYGDAETRGLAAVAGPAAAATKSAARPAAAAPPDESSRLIKAMERDGWTEA